jgi:replicative DNA helicase
MGNVVQFNQAKRLPLPKDPSGRPLPSDLAVEAALLWRLLSVDMSAELKPTLRLLIPEHFFNPSNAAIFGAMRALAAEGTCIDPVTVLSRVRNLHAPDGGWQNYINNTLTRDGANGEAPPGDYAKIILDKWRLREVMQTCYRVYAQGYDEPSSLALIDDLSTSIVGISETQIDTSGVSASEALAEAWRNIMSAGQPGQRGVSWGWPSVDRAFGRMRPGRVTVLAAVPGVGKTNIAWHVADAVTAGDVDDAGIGDSVYFVSAELKASELVGRQAGIRAGVPSEAIEGDRDFTAAEVDRLVDAQRDIKSMPIIVDDNGGRAPTVAEIEARVRIAQQRMMAGTYVTKDNRQFPRSRMPLVVVDYLTQLKAPSLPFGQKYDSREREVAAISKALAELAKVLNVHVLVIAAVSRPPTKGVDDKKRELKMSDLRESGQIEYDAASIIFANEPEPGVIRLKTDKQRFRGKADPVELAMVRGRIFEKP